jgi:phosphatidate cytidylyltransferase
MTRVISGVILAAAVLAAILFLPFIGLRVLACAVAGLGAHEYVRITDTPRPASRWIVIAAVVYTCWWAAVPAPLSLVTLAVVVIAWLAFEVVRQGRTAEQAAVNLIAPVYLGAPLGMLVALHSRSGWKGPLVIIATVIVSDSAQYYTGRAFGRRPLAPAISPKKTVEGAIGGVVFGALFMVLALGYFFPLTPIVVRVLLGMIVVFLGILGDLFESRLKRLADMKDSSALIPGHGGMLDRVDSFLFAAPVAYFYVVSILH